MKTKTVWTGNIDDAMNFPAERLIRKYQNFLKAWAECFGEDYATLSREYQDGVDDRLTLGVIDRCYSMGCIENYRYIASLARLAKAGRIKRKVRGNGWMLVRR